MNRNIPNSNPRLLKKKKKSIEMLSERYYGKNDLLATWDQHVLSGKLLKYRKDLKRRVDTHRQDIKYRGGYTL